MPIYSYRCESCGHQQDVLRKMSDPLLVQCPACHQPTYRKQVTAAGFQLKGSGWYVTDFRNPANKEPAKGVPKAENDSGGPKNDSAAKDASSPDPASPGKPAAASESSTANAKPAAGSTGGTGGSAGTGGSGGTGGNTGNSGAN